METIICRCVYCGYEWEETTESYGDKVLMEHIKSCEKHPSYTAKIKISHLRSALIGLLGTENKAELEEMRTTTRIDALMGAIPQKDASDKIAAINAILETSEE